MDPQICTYSPTNSQVHPYTTTLKSTFITRAQAHAHPHDLIQPTPDRLQRGNRGTEWFGSRS